MVRTRRVPHHAGTPRVYTHTAGEQHPFCRVSFSSCVCIAEQRHHCHSDLIGNRNKHPECLKVPTKCRSYP
eukprot:jgi/Botrbrau1/12880/Bobra.0188s0022.1